MFINCVAFPRFTWCAIIISWGWSLSGSGRGKAPGCGRSYICRRNVPGWGQSKISTEHKDGQEVQSSGHDPPLQKAPTLNSHSTADIDMPPAISTTSYQISTIKVSYKEFCYCHWVTLTALNKIDELKNWTWLKIGKNKLLYNVL